MNATPSSHPPRLAILGAGPIGLEAAAAAAEAGLPFTVFEAASQVGAHVRDWGHVRLFTPWSMNVSPRAERLLRGAGVEVPGGESDCPTGGELVGRLLEPLARLPAIARHLRLGARVRSVGREGLLKHEEIANSERRGRPFRLLVAAADGSESVATADVVIDTTGTWGSPNALGDGGIPAPGESALDRRIRRNLPDFRHEAEDWAGRTILLAGSGHSAQTAARDLAALARRAPGTRVVWLLRRADESEAFGAVPNDPLTERAALVAEAREIASGASRAFQVLRPAVVEALRPAEGGRTAVEVRNGEKSGPLAVDRILSLTGAVGDSSLYRQLQVHECYAFAAPMKLSAALLAAGGGGGDCLEQSSHGVEALSSPEPNFFILGVKSYGRNNSFLLKVGYEQVEEVFGSLTGRA